MSWLLLVGRNYLWPRGRGPQVTLLLPTLGLIIGVAALITIMTGMNGFQRLLIEGLQELSSYHLRVLAPPAHEGGDLRRLGEEIANLEGVENVTAFVESPLLLVSEAGRQRMPLVRAVDPQGFAADEGRRRVMKLLWGGAEFSDANQLILGASLAYALGVEVGDSLKILSLSFDDQGRIFELQLPFVVRALYRSPASELEQNLVFIPLQDEFLPLFGEQNINLGLKLTHPRRWSQFRQTLQELSPETPLRLLSTYEYNRSFFTALRTEKTILLLLISVIFLVMAMQVYQSLRRQVLQYRQEIAVLRAFGAKKEVLRWIFLLQSFVVAAVSIVIGNLIGIALSLNMDEILAVIGRWLRTDYQGFNTLAQTLMLRDVWVTNIMVLFFCLAAGYLAARPITGMLPAAILSHE